MNKILAMNLDRSDLPGTALKLVQLVRISGSTIVRGVPVSDDAMTLKTIAQLIGTPSTSRLSSVSPSGEIVVQSEFIHRVASFKEPLRKPGGQPVLSTTTAAFRLHTDEYFLSQPSDLVMMLCVAPDPSGRGESSIAHVDDVVAALPADAARALRARIFPRGVDRIPILRRVRRVNRIQYNGDDIREHYAETGEEIPGAIAFSTAALDEAAARVATFSYLQSGDCLIVDNRRVLHGRAAFATDSPRLLLRVRLRVNRAIRL